MSFDALRAVLVISRAKDNTKP